MDIETTKPVSQVLSIRKNKPILVLFYMRGCHFCGLMKKSWNDFKQNSPINHGEVGAHDMSNYNPVSNEESIRGFPTLRLYNKGKLVKEYEGDRSASDMLKFVKKYVKTTNAKKSNLVVVKAKKSNKINRRLLKAMSLKSKGKVKSRNGKKPSKKGKNPLKKVRKQSRKKSTKKKVKKEK